MIKHFCDFCHSEIVNTDRDEELRAEIPYRSSVNHRHVNPPKAWAVLTLSTAAQSLEACKYCLIEAAKSLDDRPQPGGGTN